MSPVTGHEFRIFRAVMRSRFDATVKVKKGMMTRQVTTVLRSLVDENNQRLSARGGRGAVRGQDPRLTRF
jgi:hypothetical protein